VERIEPTYVSLEDWDGRGHRCPHCGLIRDWRYQLANHLAKRELTGRCPVPLGTKKVEWKSDRM